MRNGTYVLLMIFAAVQVAFITWMVVNGINGDMHIQVMNSIDSGWRIMYRVYSRHVRTPGNMTRCVTYIMCRFRNNPG